LATALIDLRFGYGLIFFAHLPWQRPDFTNCRVGRIPSGACASRSPLSFRLGSRPFQRFTARRASFGTVLVMYSQGFSDLPGISLCPSDSQFRFRFHQRWNYRASLLGNLSNAAEDLFDLAYALEAEVFRFTAALLPGIGFFSLLDIAIQSFLSSWFYQVAVRHPPRTSAFAAARLAIAPPSRKDFLAANLRDLSRGMAIPQLSDQLPMVSSFLHDSSIILGSIGLPIKAGFLRSVISLPSASLARGSP